MTSARTGGRILVDQLLVHGVDRAFCVPGESYLDVLDGLYDVQDRVQLVVARQEGGAAFMAAAHGKLTGRPGVCFVTRGPGATNASIGVHSAYQDSAPMVLFVGQVPRRDIDRDAFQEIDVRATFGPLAKAAIQVEQADRLPEQTARAFHLAVSGRPGPVVVGLPEDMQADRVDVADAAPYRVVQPAPDPARVDEAMTVLAGARRPVLLVGGPGWDATSLARLRAFAAAHQVPVVTAFRHQDVFDNTDERYAGTLGLDATPGVTGYLRDADTVLVLGTRLDAISTGDYRTFPVPRGEQRLVHVHPDVAELGRVYQPHVAVNASVSTFLAAVADRPADVPAGRGEWLAAAHANYLAALDGPENTDDIDPRLLVESVQRHLPPDTLVTNGAGAYTAVVQRYYRFRHHPTQVAPQSGAMGYGLPAAVAAQLAEPQRTVVAFAGDGCLLMTGQELATAYRYGLPILVVVVNNSRYGTIRAHQEGRYPGRVSGTDLVNPDFVAYGRAFGAVAERVVTNTEFDAAVKRFAGDRRLTLVEVVAPNVG